MVQGFGNLHAQLGRLARRELLAIHPIGQITCERIGPMLAQLPPFTLLTGGVGGIPAVVGQSHYYAFLSLNREPRVVHVLPEGCSTPLCGTTEFTGITMHDRFGRGELAVQ
jgi:hypothetical protein